MTPICSDEAAYEALNWLLKGHDERQILEALAANYPDREPVAVLTSVADHLERSGRANPDVIRGWAIEATRVLYQKLVEIGDYSNALKAIKQLLAIAPHAHHEDDEYEDAGPQA